MVCSLVYITLHSECGGLSLRRDRCNAVNKPAVLGNSYPVYSKQTPKNDMLDPVLKITKKETF